MNRLHSWLILASLGCALAPGASRAFDGGSAGSSSTLDAAASSTLDAAAGTSPTYYEEALAALGMPSVPPSAGLASGGLPRALHVVPADGGLAYRALGEGTWEARVEIAERPAERVDALYDLVLALPLPAGYRSEQWRIRARRGTPDASAPFRYAGEELALKRNAPLEASWLPRLVGRPDGLPDLSGTGYRWTLWDALVRYDASAGPTVQGFASFRYTADAKALDPADPRSAAYLITWIPALDAAVAPFTLRLGATVEP